MKRLWCTTLALVLAAVPLVGVQVRSVATAATDRPAQVARAATVPGAPSNPAIAVCGVTNVAPDEGPPPSSLPSPTVLTAPGLHVIGFAVNSAGTDLVAYGLTGTQSYPRSPTGGGDFTVETYRLSSGRATLTGTVDVPWDDLAPGLQGIQGFGSSSVGPHGSLYLTLSTPTTGDILAKIDPDTGAVEWTDMHPGAVFARSYHGSFELADVVAGASSGYTVDPATGALEVATAAEEPVVDPYKGDNVDVSVSNTGDVVTDVSFAGDSALLTVYSPAGTVLATAEDALHPPDAGTRAPGSPYEPIWNSGAFMIGDTVYAMSPYGLITLAYDPDAHPRLRVKSWGAETMGGLSDPEVVASDVYVAAGDNGSPVVEAYTQTELAALAAQPKKPAEGFGNVLGIGAGLYTPATGDYFPSGSPPRVEAVFSPPWAAHARDYELSYQIADRSQITSNRWPPGQVLPVSRASEVTKPSAAWYQDFTASLAIPATDREPGVYEINADLLDLSTSPPTNVGSTCFTYSVGMPGDTLELENSALREHPLADVEVAAAEGDGLYRTGLTWSNVLPTCSSTDDSVADCGPGAINLSHSISNNGSTLAGLEASARYASAHGVQLELLLSTGEGLAAHVLVPDGFWTEDVSALLTRLKTDVPSLDAFEPVNEPNDTLGGGSAATYVHDWLEPVWAAARAVDPDASVVGGTVLGADESYWEGIATAGGFKYMNVASTHPYPGYDRGFDEEGSMSYITWLRHFLDSQGASSDPIWITELGYWSNSPATFYTVGNQVAETKLLLDTLGVTKWAYFQPEGFFSGTSSTDSVSFSLIQAGGTYHYVKPDGISMMTASRMVNDRPLLEVVATSAPEVHLLEFGPTPGGSHDLYALWASGMSVPMDIVPPAKQHDEVTVAVTGELGRPSTLTVRPDAFTPVVAGAAVQYLSVPEGAGLCLAPAQSWGANLALASAGATASASPIRPGEADRSASAAIAGTDDADNAGGGAPGWSSGLLSSDPDPSLGITFASPRRIDRVVVVGSSHDSVFAGLRDFSVSADVGDRWREVGSVTNLFFDRSAVVAFAPVTASAIRLIVTALDYGGTAGGLPPAYWGDDRPSADFLTMEFAFVYALQAYAPGMAPAAPWREEGHGHSAHVARPLRRWGRAPVRRSVGWRTTQTHRLGRRTLG